jgi:oligopeptide transport system substrate-binding protein
MRATDPATENLRGEPVDFLHQPPASTQTGGMEIEPNSLSKPPLGVPPIASAKPETEKGKKVTEASKFGVEAVDDVTLKVTLELPDKDFPKLVSHPIFRPIYGDGSSFEQARLDQATITNGAFQITKIADDGITLERSENYWDRKAVALERVRFVAANTAENALDAYKKGEVDAITNADFEPLALKLLAPYEDFRRTTHSALNFYEFNTAKPPFNDRRIREALTISIDRTKLTEGDLEGTTQPANKFFPLGEQTNEAMSLDVEKAKRLLENAGYPNGDDFPPIRLVVNRNDVQQRVARSVARMWKQNLNVDTVVVVKEVFEIEEVRKSGDFDLLRRGVVFSANDKLVNLVAVLGSAEKAIEEPAGETNTGAESTNAPEKQRPSVQIPNAKGGPSVATGDEASPNKKDTILTVTERDAIYELKAIPLYFPISYSLVKPYIRGFEVNGLDAISLKAVSIDNNWQPKPIKNE